MAEELALEQLPRERGAVDGDERPRGARREVVDRLGDELLAGRGADDVLEAVAGVEAALEVAVLALQVAGAEGALEDEVELVEVDGLREEVLRAELHRLDRGLDRPVGGEEDADRGGVLLANLPQQREAVLARHSDVGEHHVGRALVERLERRRRGLREHDVVVPPEGAPEPLARVLLVVHHEDDGLG